jgi:hypothetical protein
MFKRSITPVSAAALFAVTLASGAAEVFAQQQGGIVYQQAAYEARQRKPKRIARSFHPTTTSFTPNG